MCLLAILGAALLRPMLAAAPGAWEQPASELAEQIAAILGPGQAHLTIRNLSSISNDEIPAIRRLLAQDLKAHGVVMTGAESANTVRVTLSESARDRLLVAEVGEGNQTQVAMVDIGPIQPRLAPTTDGLTVMRQQILTSREPILSLLETPSGIVALEAGRIVIYAHGTEGWRQQQRMSVASSHAQARDPRGTLLGYASGWRFMAWLPGVECSGGPTAQSQPTDWTIQCGESDDLWAITQPPLDLTNWRTAAARANGLVTPYSAFYNSARDYFTGVVSPSVSVDLPPFYAAALLQRSAGNAALLIGGIDGKVQLAENGALKVVTGTRDWGSDFAVLHSGCDAGVQVIASTSGEAANDSLRAYELPALEAVPASAPLAMDGTVTALWTAPDGKSVLAVVRNAANEYEVDRVTALCN
ncbi:MAG: hypothetical protein P4K93_14070 [Terracidiphilus sp.]|nr:hypothetical protein [Terracidiphilus sp.]